jgi:hypothetical protein
MMDNGLDVPFQIRDLAAMSLDNIYPQPFRYFSGRRSSFPNRSSSRKETASRTYTGPTSVR